MQYMLTADEKRTALEWEKYKGYTIRPLPSTIAFYEQCVIDLCATRFSQDPRFFLYGSTPEIRNLFQANHLPLVLADRSKTMVHAMGLLTTNSIGIAANEQWLNADWLNLPVFNQAMDFMIGDDAINMVRWSFFDNFLQQAHQRLTDRGIFICHLLVKPSDELINKKVDELLVDYTQGRIRSVYDLASQLNFICYDRSHYVMGWQQTISLLGETTWAKFKNILDFKALFGLCNSQFSCPPQRLFEEKLNPYFHIKEIFYPNEHAYCVFEPVYVLQKKTVKESSCKY